MARAPFLCWLLSWQATLLPIPSWMWWMGWHLLGISTKRMKHATQCAGTFETVLYELGAHWGATPAQPQQFGRDWVCCHCRLLRYAHIKAPNAEVILHGWVDIIRHSLFPATPR